MLIDTKKISVDEHGNVKWLDADYKGKFEHLKHRADSKTLILYNSQLFMWVFPAETIKAFSNVFIFTFMFHRSFMKHYFDMHNTEYHKYRLY